jgi:hypothetical protein
MRRHPFGAALRPFENATDNLNYLADALPRFNFPHRNFRPASPNPRLYEWRVIRPEAAQSALTSRLPVRLGTTVTWAEDTPRQGCDRSDDPAAGMAGGASRPLGKFWLKAINPSSRIFTNAGTFLG